MGDLDLRYRQADLETNERNLKVFENYSDEVKEQIAKIQGLWYRSVLNKRYQVAILGESWPKF